MERKENKILLISWDDDNHDRVFWLNDTLLGIDIDTVLSSVMSFTLENIETCQKVGISEHIELSWDTVPETIGEYLQTVPQLDKTDVRLIEMEKWEDFYKKNIKKFMRKGLTEFVE